MKGHGFKARLGYALAGLRAAWRLEKSLRAHALAALAVAALLTLTSAPAHWWAVMALTIGLVVSTELLNTAIEALADHLHPHHHPAIGVCKDVAAGAVLVSSVAALVVGGAFMFEQVLPWLDAWLGQT
jgi:undecaprenol kinase